MDDQKTAPDFPVWQTHLIKKIGLPKQAFRALRDSVCVEGVDFRRGRLNHTEFTAEAAEKMRRAALQKPPAFAPAAPLDNAPDVSSTPTPPMDELTHPTPVAPQRDVELKVKKIWPLNRRRLEACLVTDGEANPADVVVLRVRDNSTFKVGQHVLGRQVEGNVFDYAGRAPYRPGVMR